MNYISWLDTLRVERHESLYGLEVIDLTRDEAENSHSRAVKFVNRIQEILYEEE